MFHIYLTKDICKMVYRLTHLVNQELKIYRHQIANLTHRPLEYVAI